MVSKDPADIDSNPPRRFAQGFGEAFPCFDMIDTGPGGPLHAKIASESWHLNHHIYTLTSPTGLFQLAVGNRQCKHVFFGCTHDRKYVNLLQSHAENPITSACITLINSGVSNAFLPFQTMPFEVINLNSTFEYLNRVDHQSAFGAATLGNPQFQKAQTRLPIGFDGPADGDIQLKESNVDKWIRYACQSPPERDTSRTDYSPGLKPHGMNSSWEEATDAVFLNVNNQRIDKALPESDPQTLIEMTKLNEKQHFCAYYLLLNNCRNNNDCNYRHSPFLDEQQLLVLKNWMRRTRCPLEGGCRKPRCFQGHSCPFLPKCPQGGSCVFSKTHDEDQTIVKMCRY